MDKAKRKLADKLAMNDDVNMEETDYFAEWVARKPDWGQDRIREFVQDKMDLMLDVKHDGLKEPIVVKMYGQICDGGHRLAMLRALGHQDVIVRLV